MGPEDGVSADLTLDNLLTPVRAYLKATDIPPTRAGAYGLVVFQYKATPANRAKLRMVCNSFLAFFPRKETSFVPPEDQMITIWPIDDPQSQEAKDDVCDFIIDHYDLNASWSAIRDAVTSQTNMEKTYWNLSNLLDGGIAQSRPRHARVQ